MKRSQKRYDIIGDVHGCAAELEALLDTLGYRRTRTRDAFSPPRPDSNFCR
ncbi:hypothetical protein MYIN104542_11735 [Mycobacterium intermedium]